MRWVPLAVFAVAFVAPHARAIEIDSFETSQSVTGPEGTLYGSSTVANPTAAIAGTRTLNADGYAVPNDSVAGSIAAGSLILSSAQTANVLSGPSAWVIWSPSSPLDLTEGGAVDSFVLIVQAQTEAGSVGIAVSSAQSCPPAGECRQWASNIGIDLDGPGVYRLRFSDFRPIDYPADFTKVLGITLGISLAPNTPPGAIQIGPVFTAPEPASLAFGGFAVLVLALRRSRSEQRPLSDAPRGPGEAT